MVDFIKKKNKTLGLQMKMSLYVVGSLLIVSSIMLFLADLKYGDQYENELMFRLDKSIGGTTRNIDQKISSVECATNTVGAIIGTSLEEADRNFVDSLLVHTIRGMQFINTTSIVLKGGYRVRRPYDHIISAYYEDDNKTISINFEEYPDGFPSDENWEYSFQKGEKHWYTMFVDEDVLPDSLVCYSVPIVDSQGSRVGIFEADISMEWIVDLVVDCKTREDIDVAIVSSDGEFVVPQDSFVANIPPNDIIQETRTIDRLGWKLLFTADHRVIEHKKNMALLRLTVNMLVLILTMIAAVVLVIRFVARPFVEEKQHIAESRAAMQREMDIASRTQQSLVPHSFPPFPERKDVDLYACLYPARNVGGDLYDYFIKDNNLYFCIGDVSGKGTPASLFMSATHYLFRSVASSMPITSSIRQMNLSLCADNAQCTFVTFFFGCLNLTTGLLEYCNAGHNSPILVSKDSKTFLPQAANAPLGVWEEEDYVMESISLSPGDTIFLYTDGVTEAKNSQDVEFGNDAAINVIPSGSETKEIVKNLLQSVRLHSGDAEQSDDITMLCICYKGSSL